MCDSLTILGKLFLCLNHRWGFKNNLCLRFFRTPELPVSLCQYRLFCTHKKYLPEIPKSIVDSVAALSLLQDSIQMEDPMCILGGKSTIMPLLFEKLFNSAGDPISAIEMANTSCDGVEDAELARSLQPTFDRLGVLALDEQDQRYEIQDEFGSEEGPKR